MSNEQHEQGTKGRPNNTRRKIEKIVGLVAVFIAVALLAFYGANAFIAYMDNPPRDSTQYSDGSQSAEWGNMSLSVPQGYELVGGTSIDKNDQDSCIIQKSGEASDYFAVQILDEQAATKKLEQLSTVEDLGQAAELTVDGVEWNGWSFSYDGGRTPSFQAYGMKDGKAMYVTSYEHAMDEDISITVMGGAIPC